MNKLEKEGLRAIKDYCNHLQYHSKNLTQKQYIGNDLVLHIVLGILNNDVTKDLKNDIKELNTLDLGKRG